MGEVRALIRYAGRDDFEVLCAHDRHVGKSELKRCIDAQRVLVMAGSGAFMGWLRFGLFWNEIRFTGIQGTGLWDPAHTPLGGGNGKARR